MATGPGLPDVAVTVSIGVAVGGGARPDPGETPEGLIAKADRALYRAKAQGRNTVDVDRSAAA